MTQSLSRQLAQWVHQLRFEDLPPAVVDRACAATLQGLTSALLGSQFPDAQQALAIMKDDGAGPGNTSVLGHDVKLGRSAAAFVNTEMMVAGGKWDTFRLVVHPGSLVLPAALAIAEETQCSGRQYLTAVAAGYEVAYRLAKDFVPTMMARGFHAGQVFGIFGAAVAAAKALDLTADQIHVAIGQCVNLAAGNLEGGPKALHEGAVARNGLLAAAIARNGGAGGELSLEGEAGFYRTYAGTLGHPLRYSFNDSLHAELSDVVADLGSQWLFLETLFRIYSTPGYNIPHVEVTAQLCRRDNIQPEDVVSIECEVHWLETQYPSPAFPTRRNDAGPERERPHYYAAYGVLERGFPLDKNVVRGVGEPDPPGLHDMMQRVRVTASHTRPLLAPRITIFTRDGKLHTLEGTGREFALEFDALASKLAPLGPKLPIGAKGYADLATECKHLDQAANVQRLISLMR